MQNDKSQGNDGLTKEFHETFLDEMKEIFVDSRFKDRLSLSSLKKLEVRDS